MCVKNGAPANLPLKPIFHFPKIPSFLKTRFQKFDKFKKPSYNKTINGKNANSHTKNHRPGDEHPMKKAYSLDYDHIIYADARTAAVA